MSNRVIQIKPNVFVFEENPIMAMSLERGKGQSLYEKFLMKYMPHKYSEKMARDFEKTCGVTVNRMVK
jgi:hypothetical protein